MHSTNLIYVTSGKNAKTNRLEMRTGKSIQIKCQYSIFIKHCFKHAILGINHNSNPPLLDHSFFSTTILVETTAQLKKTNQLILWFMSSILGVQENNKVSPQMELLGVTERQAKKLIAWEVDHFVLFQEDKIKTLSKSFWRERK